MPIIVQRISHESDFSSSTDCLSRQGGKIYSRDVPARAKCTGVKNELTRWSAAVAESKSGHPMPCIPDETIAEGRKQIDRGAERAIRGYVIVARAGTRASDARAAVIAVPALHATRAGSTFARRL